MVDGHAKAASRSAKVDTILDAAVRVLFEYGARGFTHRAVATEAGVPLGLTTYYFRDRDELLIEAMRRVRDRSRMTNATLLNEMVARAGLSRGLAEFVEEWTTRRHSQLTRNYRVYASALYQPDLQTEVAAWHPQSDLLEYVDASTAFALGVAIQGFLIDAVIHGRSFTSAEAFSVFARIVDT